MDWDIAVLVIGILATIAGFMHRRTRKQIYYWVWLGLIFVEVEFRKIRDKWSKTKRDA